MTGSTGLSVACDSVSICAMVAKPAHSSVVPCGIMIIVIACVCFVMQSIFLKGI